MCIPTSRFGIAGSIGGAQKAGPGAPREAPAAGFVCCGRPMPVGDTPPSLGAVPLQNLDMERMFVYHF
jgi:hypothetical protein